MSLFTSCPLPGLWLLGYAPMALLSVLLLLTHPDRSRWLSPALGVLQLGQGLVLLLAVLLGPPLNLFWVAGVLLLLTQSTLLLLVVQRRQLNPPVAGLLPLVHIFQLAFVVSLLLADPTWVHST